MPGVAGFGCEFIRRITEMKPQLALLAALLLAAPAHAWFPQGHSIIAAGAVQTLPNDVPIWFRAGAGQIAHDAQDPDVQKDKTLPLMTEREYPQHFLDWELIGTQTPLPPTRRAFYALCAHRKLDPFDVGELPYALAEWTGRLTMDFAEARKYPGNAYIQTKALVTAGILSHYAGDACMPLHVTNDFDGRTLPDGHSPHTGIHARVDSLIEALNLTPAQLSADQTIAPLPDLWTGIELQLRETRAHIPQTYALETQLQPFKGDYRATPAVESFALERGRTAARFTAQLFLTAWRDSEKIKLPDWLKRASE